MPAEPQPNNTEEQEQGTNKTELIRKVLECHPEGLRPVNVWKAVKEQVPRPYVYSVLSRMKAKKQAKMVRGRYLLIQQNPPVIEIREVVN